MMKLAPMNNAYPPPEGPRVTPSTLRTGHLYYNGEKVLDSSSAQKVLGHMKNAFASTREHERLLDALVASAQNPLLGDEFSVHFSPNVQGDDLNGGLATFNELILHCNQGNPFTLSLGQNNKFDPLCLLFWRDRWGKYVPEAIWDACGIKTQA